MRFLVRVAATDEEGDDAPVATGDIEQYTDVVGGAFTPVEMAERAGDRLPVADLAVRISAAGPGRLVEVEDLHDQN